MKCYNHLRYDAVATCEDCGKGLCKSCADKYSLMLCDDCNYSRARINKSRAANEIFSTLGLAVLAAVAFYHFDDGGAYRVANSISMGIFAMCISCGWRTLNMIRLIYFLFLPFGSGFIVYFVVKGLLSLAIGLIATPYRLIKNLMMILRMKKVMAYVDKMRPATPHHQTESRVILPKKKSLLEV